MKNFLWLVAIILVAGTLWLAFKPDNAEESEQDEQQTQNNPSPNSNRPDTDNMDDSDGSGTGEEEDTDDAEEPAGNVWYGHLSASTDLSRGNLILTFADSDHDLYIRTSRDYSNLIGKEVIVTFEGTKQDFQLVDIKER